MSNSSPLLWILSSKNKDISKNNSILYSWAFIALVWSGISGATTIDFETLPDLVSVTNQYSAAGVTFNNAISLTAGFSLNEIDYPPSSGNVAIGDDFSPLEIQFSSAAQNISAYFTYGSQLTFTAYDMVGTLLGTFVNPGLDNLGTSELINLGFAGVGSLTIAGTVQNSFILDDLSYTNQTSSVPLPGALVLLASGLMGLGFSKRKVARRNADLSEQ